MGRAEIAAVLIERAASINVKHRYGKTPLGAAISTNSKKLIALLLQYGGKE
jgi:ankyrin repeat protein